MGQDAERVRVEVEGREWCRHGTRNVPSTEVLHKYCATLPSGCAVCIKVTGREEPAGVSFWARMILRIVFGRFPSGIDATALVDLRSRLAPMAREVPGLESLIVGARRPSADDPNGPVEAAIVSVWRDATLMARATSVEEQDRFLGMRLQLPLELSRRSTMRSSAGRSRPCRPSRPPTSVS